MNFYPKDLSILRIFAAGEETDTQQEEVSPRHQSILHLGYLYLHLINHFCSLAAQGRNTLPDRSQAQSVREGLKGLSINPSLVMRKKGGCLEQHDGRV